MQEELVSLQLLEFEYCHMSSRTYSQHQATNRNDDKQAFKDVGEKRNNGRQNPEVNRHCITLLWLPKQCLQEPELTIPHLCLTGLLFSTSQSPRDVLCIFTADPPATFVA